jgi:TatD DNase family protein
MLHSLAREGRLDAVGETGFDLYNGAFRDTEKIQDELFSAQLAAALEYSLPVVLHVRRAMHKVFPAAQSLRRLPALVFHSWPGSASEGEALLKRGINVFFSFGTGILNNHREAMRSAALFPAERLLTETDAPYQPLRGQGFSSFRDPSRIITAAAALRREAGSPAGEKEELEAIIDSNFRRAFLDTSQG